MDVTGLLCCMMCCNHDCIVALFSPLVVHWLSLALGGLWSYCVSDITRANIQIILNVNVAVWFDPFNSY